MNVHGFEDVTDARAKMQVWKQEDNEDRPLSRTGRPCRTRYSGTHRGPNIADRVDQRSASSHAGTILWCVGIAEGGGDCECQKRERVGSEV